MPVRTKRVEATINFFSGPFSLEDGSKIRVEAFGNKPTLTQCYIPPDLVSKLKHSEYSIVGVHGWFAVRIPCDGQCSAFVLLKCHFVSA